MKKYKLENLDCAECALKLEGSIRKLAGVRSVSIDFASLTMLVDADDIGKVQNEIDKVEPGVKIADKRRDEPEHGEPFSPWREMILLGALTAVYIAGLAFKDLLESTPFHLAEYALFLSVYLLSGWKVLLNAFRNIRKGGVFDENFLMTLATGGAIAIHALSEAAGVMLFYKAGEFFQELSIHRSRKSIKALLEIRPDYANLIVNDQIRKVPPEQAAVGDRVVVKPGEKIPLDGVVLSGSTQVDASPLTGESVPRIVRETDGVLAGTINKSGMITIRVTRPFGESSISKILEMVENATHKKAKTERFFTTFAKYYTPAVVGIALLTAILPPLLMAGQDLTQWVYRALVILVISCPCALVVSIPLAYFGGIGSASSRGILIKGSNTLDALNSVKTVVFDKTGTITRGIFKVTEITPSNGFTAEELLAAAAGAESHSNHPIAVSIREAYGKGISPESIRDYQEIPGRGIRAVWRGKTVLAGNDRMMHENDIGHEACRVPGTLVHIAVDGTYAGRLLIGDEIKADSAEAMRRLERSGVKRLVMLTGDGRDIAGQTARSAGIREYTAELMPEDKVAALERLFGGKGKVAFVGDGINDAPVLARADVGISMGSLGSDAAIETADIVIMNDSLLKIPEAIRIAKRTRAILVQNIAFALGVKGLFIVLGFMGLATMWEAVFGDMGVALIAIFNSLRILRTGRP